MTARFTGICLISENVPALAAFYAAVLDADMHGDAVFTVVHAPGAALSIYSATGMEQMVSGVMARAGSGGFTVEVRVDDVDACYERLLAGGAPIVKPPTTQPWGRRSVWIRDPDGNLVNLYRLVPAPADPADVVADYLQALLVRKDLSACDRLLAPDYVDHDAPDGSRPGPANTRAYVADMFAAYPDLRFTIEQIVPLDDHVAVRATWHGTNRETGDLLRRSGLVLFRVNASGKIAERRSAYADQHHDSAGDR